MTEAQQRAFSDHWPSYGLELSDGELDLAACFDSRRPLFMEIGFGNGEALASRAAAHPENDYLGVEVHGPGVGHLLLRLAAQESRNVRVLRGDAMELLRHRLPAASLAGVYLFFPDPWPKRRHHKRRMVQAEFTRLVGRALRPGGLLHMATDWRDYAEQMMRVLSATPGFRNAAGPGRYSPRPEDRPATRFEQRGQRLGHAVWDLIFLRD